MPRAERRARQKRLKGCGTVHPSALPRPPTRRIRNRSTDATLLGWRRSVGRSRQERLAAAGSGLFSTVRACEFGRGQPRTADSLLATIATHSDLLAMDQPQRAVLLARIHGFLQARPET